MGRGDKQEGEDRGEKFSSSPLSSLSSTPYSPLPIPHSLSLNKLSVPTGGIFFNFNLDSFLRGDRG